MLSFTWNGIDWLLADIGGGTLHGAIAGHAHSKNGYELHYITGGQGELETDGQTLPLAAGDFFLTGPDVFHAQKSVDADGLSDIFIYFQLRNDKHANALGQTLLNARFLFLHDVSAKTAAALLDEYQSCRLDRQSGSTGLCLCLLTELLRLLLPDRTEDPSTLENLNDKRFIIIENAFLYDRSLTLRELSERIGLCERQTQRLLRKYYGKSFREKKKEMSDAPKS